MRPREYQLAAATALWNQIHQYPEQNPLVVMPTGTGKSLTMALFIWGFLTTYPRARILNLVHVKELVKGNHDALLDLWPAAPAGIYSAGVGRRDFLAQALFAGVQSFRNIADRFGRVDIVLVDEAHRISDKSSTTYQAIFTELRKKNPQLLVAGFTATAFRMGLGDLTDGAMFDNVCFDLSDGPAFVWMLDQKYLIRLVPKRPSVQVDESQVKIRGGEYDEASASAAFREQDILERAVDEIIEQGHDRQAWLIFAQSIDDAELIADLLKYKGYPVEAVHSKRNDRDEVLEAFKTGRLRGVVNKDILTTGYDNHRVDLIGMIRLTRSPGLWVQMLGRGTRPSWVPGYDLDTLEGRTASILASHKQTCLVLDFAGNTERLGPINYPNRPKKKGSRKGLPPTRLCPMCGTYNHISIRVCEECGYEFPPPEQKIHQEPSTAELVIDLNNLPPIAPKEFAIFKVSQMIAAKHIKRGAPGALPTMRVDYFSGVRRFSTWVCPEHTGVARDISTNWWIRHGGVGQLPSTVDRLLQATPDLNTPTHIKVWLNTKYPEIVAYDFNGTAFQLPPELGGPPLPQEEEPQSRGLRELQEMLDNDIPY